MEEFGGIQIKDELAVPFGRSGARHSISVNNIPLIKRPQTIESELPVLPLCKTFIKTAPSNISRMTFPFLIDVFHKEIEEVTETPQICPKCGAFLPFQSFTNGIPSQCPFCTSFTECSPSYIKFPKNKNQISKVIYIFVIIGNIHSGFYDYLEHFENDFILCQYTDHLTFLKQNRNGGYSTLECFESEMPPSIRMRNATKIPMFPAVDIRKSDFNEILRQVEISVPDFGGIRHIVFVNDLPHTCLTEFNLKNATFSLLSSNSIKCSCRDSCNTFGGFFLANHITMPASMNEIKNISIKSSNGNFSHNDKRLSLIAPGYFCLENSLPFISKVDSQILQIVVELNDSFVVSTFTMKSQEGIHTVLREVEFPNFMLAIAKNNVTLEQFAVDYNQTKEVIELPSSLSYITHFKPLFGYNEIPRVISRVLSQRPFVFQFKPTVRVPNFISDEIISTISILLILYDSTIYIFIGGDVSRLEWKVVLGVQPSDSMMSFEIYDTQIDSNNNINELYGGSPKDERDKRNREDTIKARNELWKAIRIIQSQFPSIYIPIIAVPSESGRRTEIVELLRCDSMNGENILLRRFGDLARAIDAK